MNELVSGILFNPAIGLLYCRRAKADKNIFRCFNYETASLSSCHLPVAAVADNSAVSNPRPHLGIIMRKNIFFSRITLRMSIPCRFAPLPPPDNQVPSPGRRDNLGHTLPARAD